MKEKTEPSPALPKITNLYKAVKVYKGQEWLKDAIVEIIARDKEDIFTRNHYGTGYQYSLIDYAFLNILEGFDNLGAFDRFQKLNKIKLQNPRLDIFYTLYNLGTEQQKINFWESKIDTDLVEAIRSLLEGTAQESDEIKTPEQGNYNTDYEIIKALMDSRQDIAPKIKRAIIHLLDTEQDVKIDGYSVQLLLHNNNTGEFLNMVAELSGNNIEYDY